MISFQYFDGYPNATESMDNFKLALKKLNIPKYDFEIIEILDLNSAKQYMFQGYPKILVHGIDIYTDEIPKQDNYTCGIYDFNKKRTGIIPREFIIGKLKQYLKLFHSS